MIWGKRKLQKRYLDSTKSQFKLPNRSPKKLATSKKTDMYLGNFRFYTKISDFLEENEQSSLLK